MLHIRIYTNNTSEYRVLLHRVCNLIVGAKFKFPALHVIHNLEVLGVTNTSNPLPPKKHRFSRMPKGLSSVEKKITKKRGKNSCLHENSRDSQRLRRATARADKLGRVASARAKADKVHCTLDAAPHVFTLNHSERSKCIG